MTQQVLISCKCPPPPKRIVPSQPHHVTQDMARPHDGGQAMAMQLVYDIGMLVRTLSCW